jgi:FKBP-type peptidyl-prolyl cis-trans isomerase
MKSTYIGIGAVIILGILFFLWQGNKTAETYDTGGNTVSSTPTTDTTATADSTTTNTTNTTQTMEPKTTTTAEGLQITDEAVGTGAEAKAGNTVTVQYVGALSNGTVFDASRNHGDTGFTFTLGAGQVIKGWDMGVAGMKVGGKRKLVIPAALAYGNQEVGGVIPANSTLTFEVELVSVK